LLDSYRDEVRGVYTPTLCLPRSGGLMAHAFVPSNGPVSLYLAATIRRAHDRLVALMNPPKGRIRDPSPDMLE